MAAAQEGRPPGPAPGWLRRLPLVGAALAVLLGTALAALAAAGTGQAVPLLVGLGALLYAGKEAAIPLAISLGANAFLAGGSVFIADLALTFALFPAVLAGLRGAEKRRGFVGRMLASSSRQAEKHRRLVDKYGAAGLFLFLLVPFAFNGPLVGAVLGRLAGLTALQSLAAVVTAMAATTIAWTTLYAHGFAELGLDPRLPALVCILVASVVVGCSVYAAWRDGRRAPAAPAVAPP